MFEHFAPRARLALAAARLRWGSSNIRSAFRSRASSLKAQARSESGGLLLETVIALAVLGVVAVAVLGAVQTSTISRGSFERQSSVENILRNQIENVFQQEYLVATDTYDSIQVPEAYTVTAEALDYNGDPNIQTVRVTIERDGEVVTVFETLRANR